MPRKYCQKILTKTLSAFDGINMLAAHAFVILGSHKPGGAL
jgi:hypothetical protein